MADANVEGHFKALLAMCGHEAWQDLWKAANVKVYTFDRLGLPENISDAELWQVCQERNILLFTGNRNRDSDDSLEATIRARSTATSLPVLTVANPDRILHDRDFAQRVIGRMLEMIDDIERLRGAGRPYLP